MKNWLKLFLIFVIVIGYVFLINIFADLISVSSENYENSKSERIGGDSVKIGVSQSVSVSVTRKPHWYGKFYVNNGKEVLNLFYICNVPWKIQKYNFWIFHIIFLIILSLSVVLIFTKKKVYKGENTSLEHESLGKNNLNFN